MHDLLYENQMRLRDDDLRSYAVGSTREPDINRQEGSKRLEFRRS